MEVLVKILFPTIRRHCTNVIPTTSYRPIRRLTSSTNHYGASMIELDSRLKSRGLTHFS